MGKSICEILLGWLILAYITSIVPEGELEAAGIKVADNAQGAPTATGLLASAGGEKDAALRIVSFGESVPKDAKIVEISTHLIVDEASPKGLNFFAIQVNFPNKTWAHGGPQLVQHDGKPFQQVNWGGLVNRGGGSKDYQEVDWKKDLLLIQCGIGKEGNTGALAVATASRVRSQSQAESRVQLFRPRRSRWGNPRHRSAAARTDTGNGILRSSLSKLTLRPTRTSCLSRR